MKRFSALCAALAIVLAPGGCGGSSRPATFGSDNRPLLKKMVEDLKAKKMDAVQKDYDALMRREKKDSEEQGAFEKIKAMADKGDWAGAQAYAEACLSASN